MRRHVGQLGVGANKHVDFFKSYTPVNTKQQTYQESQIIGEALQELLYKHINKKFKTENISLVANRLEQTQESLELRKKIRLKKRKPKKIGYLTFILCDKSNLKIQKINLRKSQ